MDFAFMIGKGRTSGIFFVVDREQASKVIGHLLLDAPATVRKQDKIVSCRGRYCQSRRS
jgi:hypothetical protein